MKLEITLEDYEKAGEEFWPKYFYVAKELGEGAKPRAGSKSNGISCWGCYEKQSQK